MRITIYGPWTRNAEYVLIFFAIAHKHIFSISITYLLNLLTVAKENTYVQIVTIFFTYLVAFTYVKIDTYHCLKVNHEWDNPPMTAKIKA